jgi:hypothetical protein
MSVKFRPTLNQRCAIGIDVANAHSFTVHDSVARYLTHTLCRDYHDDHNWCTPGRAGALSFQYLTNSLEPAELALIWQAPSTPDIPESPPVTIDSL